MQPKVSVIVPVYNVEPFLAECLDSLLNQSIEHLEIIVVNDGSTDASGQIIESYANRFSNIVYIIQNNQGLSEARNTGIRVAKGEYIAFLDSDDWVDKETYKILYDKAKLNNDEIVCCGFYMSYPHNIKSKIYVSSRQYDSVAPLDYPQVFRDIKVAAWDKIYKRDFFLRASIFYPSGLWYEDTAVSVPLLLKAKKVSVISIPLIFYRQREGSITKQSLFNPKVFDVYTSYERVVESTINLKEKSKDVYVFFFLKKCVIDNFIRLNRFHVVKEHISFLRREFFSRYTLLDIFNNKILSFKEKITSYFILVFPIATLVAISSRLNK